MRYQINRQITFGGITMALLVIGMRIAATPTTAHEGDGRHCHVTVNAEDTSEWIKFLNH